MSTCYSQKNHPHYSLRLIFNKSINHISLPLFYLSLLSNAFLKRNVVDSYWYSECIHDTEPIMWRQRHNIGCAYLYNLGLSQCTMSVLGVTISSTYDINFADRFFQHVDDLRSKLTRCGLALCLWFTSLRVLPGDPSVEVKYHDDVIQWKQVPRYWPCVRGIHRLFVDDPNHTPNKRLNKSGIRQWFETLLRSCDVTVIIKRGIRLTPRILRIIVETFIIISNVKGPYASAKLS